MTLPRTAADVLSEHVVFELESVDRMRLNVRQPRLQYGAGVWNFFVRHRGWKFASTALMAPMTQNYVAEVDHYLVLNGTRYGAHRATVGEDEQSGRMRRHDDHDQDPPRNRCLAGAASVVMVTVAARRDLLGQNRFRTV